MLTKKQFLQRLKFIMDYNESVEKYDQALKEFAQSDFTGFYDEKLHNHLLTTLAEDMEQGEDDLISWWLYDCPEAGKNPQHAKIWDGDKDDPETTEYDVSTPEKLYDYIFITYSKAPSKESIQMAIKAQDNGVRFTLKEIEKLKAKNATTKIKDWKNRDALLNFVQTQISNQYRFERGIGADLDLDKPLHIISVLEDECES